MFLTNTGALNLEDLDANSPALIEGGGVITASSPLAINADQNINGAMDFVADNDNAAAADNLTINANITHDGNGLLRFLAGDDILHTAGAVTSTGGTDNEVRFLANQEGAGSGDGDDGGIVQSGGSLTADEALFSAHETVDYSQAGNDLMRLNGTVAGATFDFSYRDQNDIEIELVSALDMVTIEAGGAITGDAGLDIMAANLLLIAATGIGQSGDVLDTQVTNLDANNSTSGGVFLTNDGAFESGRPQCELSRVD